MSALQSISITKNKNAFAFIEHMFYGSQDGEILYGRNINGLYETFDNP